MKPWRKNRSTTSFPVKNFLLPVSNMLCIAVWNLIPILYQYYFNKHPAHDSWCIRCEDQRFPYSPPLVSRIFMRIAYFLFHSNMGSFKKQLKTLLASCYPVLQSPSYF